MLNSLRSRLWITYALLIIGIIMVVAISLGFVLVRQPSRVAYQRMSAIASLIENKQISLTDVPAARLQEAIQRADKNLDARIVLFTRSGQLLADSRRNSPPIPTLPAPPAINQAQLQIEFRDSQGKIWVYAERYLEDQYILVVATPRPRTAAQSLVVLRDEVIEPMLVAALLSALLAIGLAFWLTHWVAQPLQHIAAAARDISSGRYRHITSEGPDEVQNLAVSFNEMVDQVENSHKSQRDFVANVSHELKTPLTSIQGFAQAILDGTVNTPDALHQAAGVIFEESSRMHRLVLDLLDLTRLDSGIADLRRAPIDMHGLLNGLVEKMTPQAQQAQVSLAAQLQPLPPVIGDADRLAQVFTNLVDNALKYTPAGGVVRVEASAANGLVQVFVIDSGPGIPAEERSHIFERFYQIDKSRSGAGRAGSGRGIGLGLPIAREIILAHHGILEVQSAPGQGSTFVVKIPVVGPNDSTIVKRR